MDSRSSFKGKYEKNCSLYDTIPLGGVLENVEDYFLDVEADKISVFDWNPLIDTLGSDRSLKFIAIRSFYRFEKANTRVSHLLPPIFDQNLLHRLCAGLASSLAKSKRLQCFIVQGLPLDSRDISVLTRGLDENQSVQQLSFEGCSLGDDGVFQLVPALRDKIDLFWLNLSQCNFTEKGAIRLCDLVQSQSILRFSAAWAESLRYRQPTLGKMPGLRRLTICGNSIGDRAGLIFAERLKDDRWLRCIDMQACDMSSTSLLGFIDALQVNRSLIIVDLRKNEHIEPQLLRELECHLSKNAKRGMRDPLQISWRWLGDRSPASVGPGGNQIMEVTADAAAWQKHNRSVRAYHCSKPSCSAKASTRRPIRSRSMHGRILDNSSAQENVEEPIVKESRSLLYESKNSIDNNKEIAFLRTQLSREAEGRRRLEEKLRLIELENSRLISEVVNLREGLGTTNISSIPDNALEQVEQTIAQFHSFLDFLKEKGMGNVVPDGLKSAFSEVEAVSPSDNTS